MMLIHITCTYCDHKWIKQVYSTSLVNTQTCPRCNDSNLKIKQLEDVKIDYYQGSKPFPQEEIVLEDPNDWNLM